MKKGFTLIELMVVITIISLLSSTVISSLGAARIRSQDSIRVQNLITLRSALELYYTDHGEYPKTFEGPYVPYNIDIPDSGLTNAKVRSECPNAANPGPYIPNLTPKYITTLPSDPTLDCTGATYSFFYASNGTDYKLITHPRNNTFPDFRDMSEGAWNGHYGVWTPGGALWAGVPGGIF